MLGGKVKGKATSQNTNKPKYRLKKVTSGILVGGSADLNTQVSFLFHNTIMT